MWLPGRSEEKVSLLLASLTSFSSLASFLSEEERRSRDAKLGPGFANALLNGGKSFNNFKQDESQQKKL